MASRLQAIAYDTVSDTEACHLGRYTGIIFALAIERGTQDARSFPGPSPVAQGVTPGLPKGGGTVTVAPHERPKGGPYPRPDKSLLAESGLT